MGRPLEVPKIAEPSDDEVNDYHSKFITALTELFEEQKYNYLDNPDEKQLIILWMFDFEYF